MPAPASPSGHLRSGPGLQGAAWIVGNTPDSSPRPPLGRSTLSSAGQGSGVLGCPSLPLSDGLFQVHLPNQLLALSAGSALRGGSPGHTTPPVGPDESELSQEPRFCSDSLVEGRVSCRHRRRGCPQRKAGEGKQPHRALTTPGRTLLPGGR